MQKVQVVLNNIAPFLKTGIIILTLAILTEGCFLFYG